MMFKRLQYWFMLLVPLGTSLQALAQLSLPHQVCIGTTHSYWVEGLTGSSYTWKINGQVQSSTSRNLEVQWAVTGLFQLEVQEHQDNCEGDIQTGQITVFDSPQIFAGNPVKICSGSIFRLAESSARNYSSLSWTSTGDGIFDDPASLHPDYTPGANDIRIGNLSLIFTAAGFGEGSCAQATDQLEVTVVRNEILASGINAACFGEKGTISFLFTNVADGIYPIQYDGGQISQVHVASNQAKVAVAAGTYNNLRIDSNGCISGEGVNVRITQPDPIVIEESVTEIDLKSKNNGSITLSVSGGSGTYSYRWSNGETTREIKDLAEGTYTVWVTDETNCMAQKTIILPAPNFPPHASDDEYSAGCFALSGNLLENDFDSEGDLFHIERIPVTHPKHGSLTLSPDGSFQYLGTEGYSGPDVFRYAITDEIHSAYDTASVFIYIIQDMDCDGIPDDLDLDADGDGILNLDEGNLATDTDRDGRPDYLDIDSDNDGIPDYFEAQSGKNFKQPLNADLDGDGVDDAYDIDQSGTILIPADTDQDGVPDFLDADSDSDFVPDYLEGQDEFADGKPDHTRTGKDSDNDGLDDGFDTVNRYTASGNTSGTNASMQDFDGDGTPDWRDDNDDDDIYLTRFEDMNADGDFSNDDLDSDGHPEYLDYGRDCDLFVPETFSPNNDLIHDYFQIYCINHYPNARVYIFDSLGNKIYEKDHYGNLEFWGSADQAWWNGKTDNRLVVADRGMVPPGIYFYVLQLGNGEVKKSYVLVSY